MFIRSQKLKRSLVQTFWFLFCALWLWIIISTIFIVNIVTTILIIIIIIRRHQFYKKREITKSFLFALQSSNPKVLAQSQHWPKSSSKSRLSHYVCIYIYILSSWVRDFPFYNCWGNWRCHNYKTFSLPFLCRLLCPTTLYFTHVYVSRWTEKWVSLCKPLMSLF